MTDIMTKAQRSVLMSKIKSKNTGIEVSIKKELKRRGVRGFVMHAELNGKPDFVFRKKKIAVFCDGDFWHGYKFAMWKDSLNKFWRNKIASNMERDRQVNVALRKNGWRVIRIWGHAIKRNPEASTNKILKIVKGT